MEQSNETCNNTNDLKKKKKKKKASWVKDMRYKSVHTPSFHLYLILSDRMQISGFQELEIGGKVATKGHQGNKNVLYLTWGGSG